MRIFNLTGTAGGRPEILHVWRRVSVNPGESVEVPGFLRADQELLRMVGQGMLAFDELPAVEEPVTEKPKKKRK